MCSSGSAVCSEGDRALEERSEASDFHTAVGEEHSRIADLILHKATIITLGNRWTSRFPSSPINELGCIIIIPLLL